MERVGGEGLGDPLTRSGHHLLKADPGHHMLKADPGHHMLKADPGHHMLKADSGHHMLKADPGHHLLKGEPGHHLASKRESLAGSKEAASSGAAFLDPAAMGGPVDEEQAADRLKDW